MVSHGASAHAVSVGDGATLERAVVRMRGTAGETMIAGSMSGGAVDNSVCHGYGEGTVHGVSASANTTTYRLRNVTAVSTAQAGEGLRLGVSDGTATMNATTVIARGPTGDIRVGAGLAGGKATLHIDHSDWAAQSTTASPRPRSTRPATARPAARRASPSAGSYDVM